MTRRMWTAAAAIAALGLSFAQPGAPSRQRTITVPSPTMSARPNDGELLAARVLAHRASRDANRVTPPRPPVRAGALAMESTADRRATTVGGDGHPASTRGSAVVRSAADAAGLPRRQRLKTSPAAPARTEAAATPPAVPVTRQAGRGATTRVGPSRRSSNKTPRSVAPGRSLGVLDITAYCATGNRNAAGRWPRIGEIATLSRRIPFGTRIRIEGLGVFVVRDRVGHSSDVDLYMGAAGCHSKAMRFGRRRLVVTVLR